MFSKTILLSALAAIGLVQASPLKDVNEKRLCGTTVLPNGLFQLSQADPNTPSISSNVVSISQAANGQNIRSELVTFAPLGAGTYGCELHITMPAAAGFSSTGGPPTLSVFKVKQPVSEPHTFANTQLEPSLYGSVTVQAGQSATINTEDCRGGTGAGLAYVFKYADSNTAAGSMSWTQGTSVTAPAGVFLVHNC
ncbi:hypothetical protein ACMFMG_003232 [Clarireedia jacksonii]